MAGSPCAERLVIVPDPHFILEPNPARRIGPDGAHRQQKVDHGSGRAVGPANRRRRLSRKRRHRAEALGSRRSKQGTEPRQALSDSHLA